MVLKRRLGMPAAVIAAIVYFLGAVWIESIFSRAGLLLVIYFLYLGLAMAIAVAFYRSDTDRLKRRREQRELVFRRTEPFNTFGSSLLDFEYVFPCDDCAVLDEVNQRIAREIPASTPFGPLQELTAVDEDRRLTVGQSRTFSLAQAPATPWGSVLSLLVSARQIGRMCSVQWWFIGAGFVDGAKLTSFVVWSPVTLPLWLVPRIRGDFDMAEALRTRYPAFYDANELASSVRAAHKQIIDVICTVLDGHGIDTSDLKTQQAQIMNIQISGGRTTFGNVVQGALNRVGASPRGQK